MKAGRLVALLVLVVVGWLLVSLGDETPRTGRSQDLVLIPAGVVNSVAFSPDGRQVLTAVSQSGMSALLWDAETGALVSTFWITYDPGALSAAFSPDGHEIVTATGRNALVWKADNGHLLATLSGHKGSIVSVAFSGDGRRIVTASADGTALVWHVASEAGETASPAIKLVGHQKELSGAVFSPDGRRVMTISRLDHSARLWDTETGKPLLDLAVKGEVSSAEFAADGRRILIASSDGKMHLYDAESGATLLTLDAGFGLWRATFSPDGRHIVSSETTSRGYARLWDANSGQPVMVLAGHSAWVTSAAFSEDGRRIVTASKDKTVRLWDAGTAEPLATLAGHAATVWGATFSPDGRRIATRAADGTVRVWQILAQPPYHDASAVPLVKRQVLDLGEWTASRYEAARRWLVDGR